MLHPATCKRLLPLSVSKLVGNKSIPKEGHEEAGGKRNMAPVRRKSAISRLAQEGEHSRRVLLIVERSPGEPLSEPSRARGSEYGSEGRIRALPL